MRILGEKVRQFRKRKGMSQKELAEGICTQATISLIEKKSKIPSMKIMMKICNRLGIRLSEVIIENDDQLYRTFKKINLLIRQDNLEAANTTFTKIRPKQLRSITDKKQYYYYEGYLQLMLGDNADEAIFNFGMLLNQFVKSSHDMFAILATLGTGLAYERKQSYDKAEIFVKQAVATLDNMDAEALPIGDDDYLQNEILIYASAAQLYAKINFPEAALELIDLALKKAQESQSLYLLDRLYAQKAANEVVLNDIQAAHDHYYVAYALSLVTHNATLTQKITEEMANYHIAPLQVAKEA
ncbi:XRE family transcriptional regulator [Lactobacillus sp. CBA3605]|uniref:helix-turn-helix transcriptional regulator n=1 Tax=Lactobacillus sp. CBA3605 TaxID=2099788 RepID=UPI000CFC2F30|nr:helix-turn-helix transcriptional regulator [Lactobacillus sp. CBA3605]AVK60790.1 XRE family transcriptional regulator [Lactobacillus sp. CBA3605]